jgi:hypothetical protein
LRAPFEGDHQYFSGNADDRDNTLTKAVDLTGAATAALQLQGRYTIEEEYDYLYFEVSTDGTTWTPVDGTVNGEPIGTDGAEPPRPALDGTSNGAWVPITIPLDAYAGQKINVRLHYKTDGGLSAGGFFGDNFTIVKDGTAAEVDGAGRPDLDGEGLQRGRCLDHRRVRQLLHRGQPHVRVVRQVPEDRSVQLRRPGAAELGGALPVPERSVDLVRQLVLERQQHQRAPG